MALQEFLIQYRRTPLETGLSPCELLNGRQIRTRIDVLRPSPSHLANEVAGVNTSGRHNSRFAVGSPCYVKYFGPHRDRQPRWVPAIINQILGPRLFMAKSLMQGYSWRRHIDQIRPRFGVEQDSDPGDPVAEQDQCRSRGQEKCKDRSKNQDQKFSFHLRFCPEDQKGFVNS